MNRNLTHEEINAIAEMGFKVYMTTNPHFQTYCFYSDGARIGYLQKEDLTGGLSISTVHLANRQTGTGYRMSQDFPLTREALEMGFAFAPEWALQRDLPSIRKYKSLEDFLSSRMSGSLVQVAGEGVTA